MRKIQTLTVDVAGLRRSYVVSSSTSMSSTCSIIMHIAYTHKWLSLLPKYFRILRTKKHWPCMALDSNDMFEISELCPGDSHAYLVCPREAHKSPACP